MAYRIFAPKHRTPRLSDVVERANGTLKRARRPQHKKLQQQASVPPMPLSKDERDRLITELSSYLDVSNFDKQRSDRDDPHRNRPDPGRSADALPSSNFEGAGRLDAKATLNNDSIAEPQRLGVLTVVAPGGARNLISPAEQDDTRSGEIAALFELRDETLVQAQVQMDELATGLARSFSDLPVSFTDDDDGSENNCLV